MPIRAGVGLFGLSKGAAAGVMAAADDALLRCAVTDGMFGTRTTMIPYMAQWVMIYTPRKEAREASAEVVPGPCRRPRPQADRGRPQTSSIRPW